MNQEMTDSELVGELVALVGPTLVGLAARTSRRSDVEGWLSGSTGLQADQRECLQVAYQCLKDIAEDRGEDMARAWFIGANTGLTEVSPCEALHDLQCDDVRISAKRFLDREEMGG